MKDKRLAFIIAAIVFLLVAVIALVAMLTGVLNFGSKPTPATTQTATSSIVAPVSSSESTTATTSEAATATTSESTAEGTETEDKTATVTFAFYVHGEEIHRFDVKNAVGKSVMEAMASTEDIVFTFNEDEGIIDTIFDHINDGESSWVYLLNDQVAEKGVKSQKLEKGDKIAWYFGSIDEIPTTIIPASDEESSEE